MKLKSTKPSLRSRVRNMMEEEACFIMRARRLSRIVTRAYDDALRGSGLTGSQFTLLFALAATGPLQAVTIVKELDIEKSTLSRTAARMIKLGWLEERKEDRTPKTLALTSLGEQVLEKALPRWQEAQERAIGVFDSDGSSALNRLIEQAHEI